jgi:hypothetical protein
MGINKSQPQLDFVDVPVNADLPVFVDPFAIAQRPDELSQTCHKTLITFFQLIVDSIRGGDDEGARRLLLHLREPNETRLGLSAKRPRGAGIGQRQATELYEALKDSSAVTTGFIASLEECELMIDGISRDKISDLTTNIIRRSLVKYTQDQCELLGIPVRTVALPPWFDAATLQWRQDYWDVPVHNDKPIVLVPKIFVRRDPAYDAQRYYHHFVLDFLQAEELSANSSLVKAFKDGTRYVTKKDVAAKYPLSKEFLYQFSKKHPEVLKRYRAYLEKMESGSNAAALEGFEEDAVTAESLAVILKKTPPGKQHADAYHDLMIGVAEFLFFPYLVNPKKEEKIHQGRKRIDIVMDNSASSGVFRRIHEVAHLPCFYVVCECKNYKGEIANPELDQIMGRFSTNRGRVGFLLCRQFDDRAKFVERCRDTMRDGNGLIIPLDDKAVLRLLDLIESGKRDQLDGEFTKLVDEVWLA